MESIDIEANLKIYLGAREPTGRYASFDYCFNHFQFHREQDRLPDLVEGEVLQLSCLHLGFYLASWGMLRGSSHLLRRSVKHYVPLIEVIANAPPEIWALDAEHYGDGNCAGLFETAQHIRAALPEGASQVLVTKILLGVFGCVPAFDTYFRKGFGVSQFGPRGLRKIGEFYASNAAVIERHRVPTLDFESGEPTERRYTQAKVIDMIFFVAGGS